MYIPSTYQVTDNDEIKHFIHHHPFATVITKDQQGQITATHMPILMHDFGDRLVLFGHFAKSNTQWQSLNHDDDMLIIFEGPHGYISSTWYAQQDVPTWDYQSIHVYGHSWLTDAQETKADLITLLEHFEPKQGARFEHLSDDTLSQIHGIIGFRMDITHVEAAYKLSQNRSTTDLQSIIKQLKHNDNEALAQAIETYALKPKQTD